MESKFVLGVVLETVKLFHLYGFNTCILISNVASSNLTTIKTTMGESGVFEFTAVINPSFTNPFNPSRKIHWVMYSSHQVTAVSSQYIAWTLRHTPQNIFQGQNIHSNIHSNGYPQECNWPSQLSFVTFATCDSSINNSLRSATTCKKIGKFLSYTGGATSAQRHRNVHTSLQSPEALQGPANTVSLT